MRQNIWPHTSMRLPSGLSLASKAVTRHAYPARRSIPPFRTYCWRRERYGLGATLTTLYLNFEKSAEAALGLPPGGYSYALLPIGYPMGRFGPVRRVALADIVYEDRWGHFYRICSGPKRPVSWPERLPSQRSARANVCAGSDPPWPRKGLPGLLKHG